MSTIRITACFIVTAVIAVIFSYSVALAATNPNGCRAATEEEKAKLRAIGVTSEVVCDNTDVPALNLDGFDQFYQRLKSTSPCNKNNCTLACRTRNTGAMVCSSTSRKWNSIGCHRINNTAIFPTVSHGFAAHIDLLRRYCGTHKRCTLISAISRWAPAGHGNNNPSAYANTVSKWAGVPTNKVYDPNDVELMARIALSMSCVENGSVPYSLDELKKGIVMAGGGQRVPVPANVGQLLQQSNAYTSASNPNSLYNSFANSSVGRFLGLPQRPASSNTTSNEGGRAPDQASTYRNGSSSSPSSRNASGENESSNSGSLLRSATSTNAANNSLTGGSPAPEQKKTTLHNTTPTLLCLPSPVGAGETALIMWACRDGAYKTSGENIDTNNQTIGSVKVTPTQTTTYTVTCINDIKNVDNTAASCQIDVANPALALIATPNTASRGQTVTLSWKTKDTTSCTLTSNDHPTYTRSGVEGDAVSPTLTRNTTFTLECETTLGVRERREITVGVR